MLINLYSPRTREIQLRQVRVGQLLVGLRITSFVIENREEAAKLLTEEGQKWLANNVLPAFTKLPE